MAVLQADSGSTNSAQVPAAAADLSAGQQKTPAEENRPAGHHHRHFHSHGYRVHNEITYRGIDWILNSTVGVATTYWADKTESGKKYFQKPITGVFEALLKPVLKKPENIAEGAKWGTRFASIMAGGFTIIPLMMLMENKKTKKRVVRWFDEKIYGRDTVANDPRFQASYDKIDEEPRKGFWTGMGARIIALAPLITASSIPQINNVLIRNLYDPIGKRTQWLVQKVGIKPIKTILENGTQMADGALGRKGAAFVETEALSKWDFLHRIIGFDFGLTVFYAVFHEMAYKTMAKVRAKKHKQEALEEVAHLKASSGTSASSDDPPSTADKGTSWADKNAPAKRRLEKAASHASMVDTSRNTADQAVQI